VKPHAPVYNIVGGKPRGAPDATNFEHWSLPDTDEHDVSAALKAARAQPRIYLDAAVEALADIGRTGTWISDEDLHVISARTGSTVKYLRTSISRLNVWLAELPESLTQHGKVSRYGYRDATGIWTGDLTTALVLAGDATAVGPLALAHTVLAGARVVVKGSRFEPLAPYQFVRALAERGIPAPQLLFFNGASNTGGLLLTRMIENTAQSVIYGEDRTISSVYGQVATDAGHKKIGFWAGRSGVLVLPDADPVLAGRCIAVGTGEDRGNRCISTMKAVIPAEMADWVIDSAIGTAEGFHRGDPLDPNTDIGTLPAQTRQEVLAAVGTAKILYDRDLIFVLCEGDHYLLREEMPYPVCAIRTYEADEDPVQILNDTTRHTTAHRGLELSVFTANEEQLASVAERTTACKVIHNRATTDLNLNTAHQGIYLFRELMRFASIC
jgi:Aldehyde dehydrogenase family